MNDTPTNRDKLGNAPNIDRGGRFRRPWRVLTGKGQIAPESPEIPSREALFRNCSVRYGADGRIEWFVIDDPQAVSAQDQASLDAVETHLFGEGEKPTVFEDMINLRDSDPALLSFSELLSEVERLRIDLGASASRERYWKSRDVEARAEIEAMRATGHVLEDNLEQATGELRTARQLIDDAFPAVRLVNDWATWEDSSLYAYADAILAKRNWLGEPRDWIFDALAEIRKVARGRLGDDGFRVPPTYTEEQRRAAINVINDSDRRLWRLGGPGGGWIKGAELIEEIATALGMRKAGA